MLQSGRVAFGAMETVVFGKPAAETVAEEARRRDAERVFLMVSGTLNRTTDEITKVRRALGNRFVGLFDHMPPHTPRHAVIEAAEMAREAGADLIVRLDHRRRQGRAAVPRQQRPQRGGDRRPQAGQGRTAHSARRWT